MPGQTNPLSQHWTDILPPLPPQDVSGWLWFSSLVLLVLVVLGVYVLWQQQPRRRALRILQRCGRQLQTLSTDSRQIALTVHRALLQGLGLTPATALREVHPSNRQWQDFYHQLQQCVFQATPPAADELAGLIRQACYWLRHARG